MLTFVLLCSSILKFYINLLLIYRNNKFETRIINQLVYNYAINSNLYVCVIFNGETTARLGWTSFDRR